QYRAPYRWLSKLGLNPSRHGWQGWLQTEKALPRSALGDADVMTVILDSARAALREIGIPLQRLRWLLYGQGDPNDWRLVHDDAVGIRYTPLTTRGHARMGARERVLETAQKYPDRLRVELNALATRVILDQQNRAVGVEYLSGERLYRAHS